MKKMMNGCHEAALLAGDWFCWNGSKLFRRCSLGVAMALYVPVKPRLEQPHSSEPVVDAAEPGECSYLSERI